MVGLDEDHLVAGDRVGGRRRRGDVRFRRRRRHGRVANRPLPRLHEARAVVPGIRRAVVRRRIADPVDAVRPDRVAHLGVHDGARREVQRLEVEVAAVVGGEHLAGRTADPPRDLVLVKARVPGLDPQHRVARHRTDRGVLNAHLAGVPHPGDPRHHVLTADLIPVEPDPAHDRVLARPPLAARVHAAALVGPDDPAGQALLADPPPPLVLGEEHLLGARHDRVVEVARLAAGVAVANHVARGVRVLVDQGAERVADLVQRDQRALGRAAGRGRLAAADAAVGERVEDRQRLDVLRRARDAQDRSHVGVDDPVVRLVARLARVHARRVVLRVVRAADGRPAVDRASGQRVRTTVLEDHPQRGPLAVDRPFAYAAVADGAVGATDPAVRVAAAAVVDRGDLDRIHVHVVAIAAERLGRPHDRQVPVHVGEEDALLVVLVAVSEDDQVQPLRGWTGHLDRVDLRRRQRQRRWRPLRARRRPWQRGQDAEQERGSHQGLHASFHRNTDLHRSDRQRSAPSPLLPSPITEAIRAVRANTSDNWRKSMFDHSATGEARVRRARPQPRLA